MPLASSRSRVRLMKEAQRSCITVQISCSTELPRSRTRKTSARIRRACTATSKLLGEWFARDAPRHYVLRVESLFGGLTDALDAVHAASKRQSSVDRIIDAIVDRREARVFVDRVVSPSYVDDVAMRPRMVVERGAPEGLYHCVNFRDEHVVRAGSGSGMAVGRDGRLIPISVADVELRAARPKFCALSNAKLASVGIAMPTWQDALAATLRR